MGDVLYVPYSIIVQSLLTGFIIFFNYIFLKKFRVKQSFTEFFTVMQSEIN